MVLLVTYRDGTDLEKFLYTPLHAFMKQNNITMQCWDHRQQLWRLKGSKPETRKVWPYEGGLNTVTKNSVRVWSEDVRSKEKRECIKIFANGIKNQDIILASEEYKRKFDEKKKRNSRKHNPYLVKP